MAPGRRAWTRQKATLHEDEHSNNTVTVNLSLLKSLVASKLGCEEEPAAQTVMLHQNRGSISPVTSFFSFLLPGGGSQAGEPGQGGGGAGGADGHTTPEAGGAEGSH